MLQSGGRDPMTKELRELVTAFAPVDRAPTPLPMKADGTAATGAP